MKNNKITYEKSGVNIKQADKFINFISSRLNKSSKSGKFKNIGGFGSINKIPKNIKNPYLVACTDGVGTKIEIANKLNKFNTIGIDLVAMNVNDLIVQGAKPMLFLDYISINKINLKKMKEIVKGILIGCKQSGCQLVGGETAEMPGTYNKGKFDIAGFAVGLVDKSKILKKNKIKKNNIILAIPSSGIHSNGFSLIRHLINIKNININKNNFLKKQFLIPTKIYVKEILKLIEKNYINGCVNITGGGIKENVKRVIPQKLTASINLNNIKTLKIFSWLKSKGINEKEMLKTFNCGVGFCLIVDKKYVSNIKKIFSKNYKPYEIGKIIEGNDKIKLNGKINW
tara:strand:- start:1720 stop:2745 length:1026 start_codon:yes stop_codon:yes gene_type:complete